MKTMKIALDADDAALTLKRILFEHLSSRGYDITDCAYSATKPASYPEIGYHLAQAVKRGDYERGILICGTGLGMAMIANKVKGIYAGVCHDVFSAQRLVMSNNAQILTMGERVIGCEHAKLIAEAFLSSSFAGGGSTEKVARLRELEEESFSKK